LEKTSSELICTDTTVGLIHMAQNPKTPKPQNPMRL
jgi:hypothetical protein